MKTSKKKQFVQEQRQALRHASGDTMLIGKIRKLVHLSQQTHLPNARLVPDHNDKGYGLIEDEDGRDVYFPHEVVQSRHGFDDLRLGQMVEYTLENAPYVRADLVRLVTSIPANMQRSAA